MYGLDDRLSGEYRHKHLHREAFVTRTYLSLAEGGYTMYTLPSTIHCTILGTRCGTQKSELCSTLYTV